MSRIDGNARPLAGLRVTLRSATPDVAQALGPWFVDAQREIYGIGSHAGTPATFNDWLAGTGAHSGRSLIALDGEPIGFMTYSVHGDRLTIAEIATSPQHRGRGFGAEAVYAIEAASGASQAAALVPLANGLAIYFWLRAGYRPLFRGVHGHADCTVLLRQIRAGVNGRDAAATAATQNTP